MAKAAAVKTHSATAVLVGVPIDAETGPVQALASGGVQSDPSDPVKILPPPPVETQAELTPAPGAPSLETATSTAKWLLGRSAASSSHISSPCAAAMTTGRAARSSTPPTGPAAGCCLVIAGADARA